MYHEECSFIKFCSLILRPSQEFELRQPLDWLIHHLSYHNSVVGALQSVNAVFRASVALLQNRADVVFDPRLVKEADKEKQKRECEKMGDAMKSLENRTLDSKGRSISLLLWMR
ncbi:putative cu(+) exporting ATPase [Rosa chinensis]|uniref:Putative cu(+) exporting ATPase n=1 Tax=Rosa chinensis TaxID=74649 RepID=A0A2P6P7T3_ROSCH|nr:putative cu(+) exporting ATPase [Rosa chinensis]